MRSFNLFTPLILITFISCTKQNVIKIDSFESVELNTTEFSPSETQIREKNYYVYSENSDLRDLLISIPNVIVQEFQSDDIDYQISLDIDKKRFGTKELTLGKIVIDNIRSGVHEDIIPLMDMNLSSHSTLQKVKNFFSIERGYVVEKRQNRDDNLIFKINIGKTSGLKKGTLLNIYGYQEKLGFLSGEKRRATYKIGIAVVSEHITESSAWIYLQNSKLNDRVVKGSMVTIKQRNFDTYLEDGKLFMKSNEEILENNIRL